MKTINIEIPIEDIAERYLKLGGTRYMFSMRHLNGDPTQFYTMEVQDYHLPTGEVRLRFTLRNGPNAVKETMLTLADIFEGPQRLEEMRQLLKQIAERKNERQQAP